MPIFDDWCHCEVHDDGRKRLLRFAERADGRAAIADRLRGVIRSHYEDHARIAEDVRDLGFAGAAAILAERLPRTDTARSGDLGEILATELVEEQLGFAVPIRRLRYKDSREMPLRGDDFIGVRAEAGGELSFLKGEAKSRVRLAADVIREAREALSRDHGRPTAASLLFIADRLMETDGAPAQLGRAIRNEVASRAVPPARIEHALFAMSGNATPVAMREDLLNADEGRHHTVVHLHVEDHQDFVRLTYEGALDLGNG